MALRFIFASVVSARHFSKMHTDIDVNDRLLSYAELRYSAPDFLHAYVTTGLHPEKVKGRRLRDETWDSPVPRVVNVKVGKERPVDKPTVKKSRRHWQSSTFRKRKALAHILKVEAYSLEEELAE
jgi:hypothetical protein